MGYESFQAVCFIHGLGLGSSDAMAVDKGYRCGRAGGGGREHAGEGWEVGEGESVPEVGVMGCAFGEAVILVDTES